MSTEKTNPTADSTEETEVEGEDVSQEEQVSTDLEEDADDVISRLLASDETEKVAATEKKEPEAKSLDLEILKAVTGREFKDADDFQKHYKNLNAFVGDEKVTADRQKAEEYDKIMADAAKIEEELAKQEQPVKTDVGPEVKEIKSEVETLRNELLEERFLKTNPEAEGVLNLVKAAAKQNGISLQKAYTDYGIKELVDNKKSLEDVKTKDLGVKSTNRVVPSKRQLMSGLVKTYQDNKNSKTPKGVSDLEERIVKESLGV